MGVVCRVYLDRSFAFSILPVWDFDNGHTIGFGVFVKNLFYCTDQGMTLLEEK